MARFHLISGIGGVRGLFRRLAIAALAFFSVDCVALAGNLPGTPVDVHEALSVYLFVPKGAVKNNNGSFELGLGTSDVFPGYVFRYKAYDAAKLAMLKKTPPPPVVTTNEHHSGSKSLQLTIDVPQRAPMMNFRVPYLKDGVERTLTLSFWIKASDPKTRYDIALTGSSGSLKLRNKPMPTKWTRVTGSVTVKDNWPGVRLDIHPGKNTPAKVWIDDVTWSVGKPADYALPAAEILLNPVSRDGIVFQGKKTTISWSVRGASKRAVVTELYLRDGTRGGLTMRLARKKASISPTPSRLSFECPPLPPGEYMLAVVARDASTKEILAQDHQLLAVLTDLRNIPKPVKFAMGGMYAFDEPLGFFHRGINSLDDLYRTNAAIGCRLIRDLHIWEKIEPEYKKRDWPYFDYLMGVAHKYGCGFMFDIPGVPFKIHGGQLKKVKKNGYWPVVHGHLLGLKKKLLDEKNLKEDEFVAINRSDTFWYPEIDYTRAFCKEFMGRYKDKALWVVEYKNEVNAMVPAKINVEKFMSPIYQAMKKAAPNVPVIVNNTGGGGTVYLERLIKVGGLPYMDGFSFHPYAHSILMFGSLENVRMYREYLDKISPDRKLALGQSEIIFLGRSIVQRVLSDWVGGCRWSCGLPWRCFYASIHAAYHGWHDTGPLLPGINGVHLNGINAALSGARLVGSVKRIPRTLIGFFEKTDPGGGKKYVAAVCAEYRPGKALALKSAGLADLRCRAYDICGAPCRPPIIGDILLATDETVYLSCDSPSLFKLLSAAQPEWVNYAQSMTPVPSASPVEKILTGAPPKRNVSVPDHWTCAAMAKAASGQPAENREIRVAPATGNIRLEPVTGKPFMRLATTVYSLNPTVKSLAVSPFGISGLDAFVNGKHVETRKIRPGTRLGEDWIEIPVPLKVGENRLEIVLEAATASPMIAKILLEAPERWRMSDLAGSKPSRVNRTMAPGVSVHASDMAAPPRKGGGVYARMGLDALIIPPGRTDYIVFKGNRKGTPALRFEFVDGEPHVVNGYVIHPRVYWFPQHFEFQGSNDGKEWITLDEVRVRVARKRQVITREFENAKAYRMYRFNFDIKGRTPLIGLKGIRLTERKK